MDFFALHAHAVVSLWTYLEVLLEDFIVALLPNNLGTLALEPFRKVKIPLAEFETLDKEGGMRVLFQELDRAAIGKLGVDRFEHILANFDLSGPIHVDDKRTIFEMQHVRNVLVHRAGRADQRLVKNCPWLKLKVHDRVNVTRKQYRSYQKTMCEYALLLATRLAKGLNIESEPAIEELRSSLCHSTNSNLHRQRKRAAEKAHPSK